MSSNCLTKKPWPCGSSEFNINRYGYLLEFQFCSSSIHIDSDTDASELYLEKHCKTEIQDRNVQKLQSI